MEAGENSFFVPTKSSTLNRNSSHNHNVTVHEDYKKKVSGEKLLKSNKKLSAEEPKEIDMKAVRYEVYKFGKFGLSSSKFKSNKELAIELGAKAPKRIGINYKVLKVERKNETKVQIEQKYLQQISQQFKGKSIDISRRMSQFKRKRKTNGILNIYGKNKSNLMKSKQTQGVT